MMILNPWQSMKNLHSTRLKMNVLNYPDAPTAVSGEKDNYRMLVSLRADLQQVPTDILSLRLVLTRICSAFATTLYAGQPLSLRILLKSEFTKLRAAYKRLDEEPATPQHVIDVFLDSIDSILLLMNR